MSQRSILLPGKLWTRGSTGLLAYCQHLPELVFNKSLWSKKISCLRRGGIGSLSGGPWELLSYLVAVSCIPDISHSFIIANPPGAALHRTSFAVSSYWMGTDTGVYTSMVTRISVSAWQTGLYFKWPVWASWMWWRAELGPFYIHPDIWTYQNEPWFYIALVVIIIIMFPMASEHQFHQSTDYWNFNC